MRKKGDGTENSCEKCCGFPPAVTGIPSLFKFEFFLNNNFIIFRGGTDRDRDERRQRLLLLAGFGGEQLHSGSSIRNLNLNVKILF